VTAVFYNKQLMTLSDALWTVYQERCEEGNTDTSNLLFGHCVQISNETGSVSIQADKDFMSRIFIPDVKEEDKFSPTSLGIYANDLAFDPDSNEEQYFENSERNNILQLVWRLAKDEKTGMVVPTWPVVVTKQDIRLLNTVPMEVGLQYGFNYWNAVLTEGASKYIK
jgi:ribosomal protein L39E